jgi:hypothetical protein
MIVITMSTREHTTITQISIVSVITIYIIAKNVCYNSSHMCRPRCSGSIRLSLDVNAMIIVNIQHECAFWIFCKCILYIFLMLICNLRNNWKFLTMKFVGMHKTLYYNNYYHYIQYITIINSDNSDLITMKLISVC